MLELNLLWEGDIIVVKGKWDVDRNASRSYGRSEKSCAKLCRREELGKKFGGKSSNISLFSRWNVKIFPQIYCSFNMIMKFYHSTDGNSIRMKKVDRISGVYPVSSRPKISKLFRFNDPRLDFFLEIPWMHQFNTVSAS